MRSLMILAALAAGHWGPALAQEGKAGAPRPASAPSGAAVPATPPPAASADEQALRQAAAAFVKTYNAHAAHAVAQLFTADAEVVDEEGASTSGRAAIEQVFARVFEQHPQTRLDLAIAAIRFLGPNVAIEEGTSTVHHAAEEPAERNRYTVVHVKQQGQWLMAQARDFPDEAGTADEELHQLAWLVGDWVDESPDLVILTSYRWTDNLRFLLSEFSVQHQGQPALTGTQRIGWDPLAKQLRSWVFDSEGGFAEGLWTRAGQQWIVKQSGVTREGKVGSSTNITTRVTKDRMLWQSRDRVVGGELQPDIEPVPIVRKPPPAQ